jgi:hypothetical protein
MADKSTRVTLESVGLKPRDDNPLNFKIVGTEEPDVFLETLTKKQKAAFNRLKKLYEASGLNLIQELSKDEIRIGKELKFAKGGTPMATQIEAKDNGILNPIPDQEEQMEMMLEGGGLKDEGGTTDPVSGNEVPDGATQKGVRDDVPAMLSEGEYVMNEASTRYHGVDKFNQMQEEAKQGYKQMERDGLLGETVDDTEEALPFGMADLNVSDEEGRELRMAEGGDVSTQRKLLQDDIDSDVFNVRRREQPTFGESMGGSGLQFKQYKNADGMNVMIPFINGVPMFSIPEGYELVDPNDPDATPEPTPVDPPAEIVETEEERIRRMQSEGGPDDPEAGQVRGFDQMSPNEVFAFSNLLSKFSPTLEKNWPGLNRAKEIATVTTSGQFSRKQQSEDAMKTEREIASREAEKDASTIAGPTGGSQRTRPGQSPRGGRGTVGYTQADTSSPTMNFNDPSEAAEYGATVDAATDFAAAAEAGGTGDVGEFGAPGQDEGPTGATAGDYGYFNKGGLAGKKPKKKMKTYKKGGLATSKK